MRVATVLIAALLTMARVVFADPAGKAARVVVVVWDGMRPDFVSAGTTPTLAKLAAEGVSFRHHHAVYPSSTEVNGTALATGMYPERSGIVGNREYRPAIEPLKAIDTQDPIAARRGDELTHGKYLAVPTVAELLQKRGDRTVIAGSKAVAFLHDRGVDRSTPAAARSITLFAGRASPDEARAPIEEALGPFPTPSGKPQDAPYTNSLTWTTRAVTELFWKDDVPKFTLLWLGEPDLTQHACGVGSPAALKAIRGADDCLKAVLDALDARGLRASTDIFVVSDHGFSTITQVPDISAALTAGGFDASKVYVEPPRPGQVVTVSNGGTVFFYVAGRDKGVTRRLVDFLQRSDFAANVFARDEAPGAFPLSAARIDSPDAPDVVISLPWSAATNSAGIAGALVAFDKLPGQGHHASLAARDMHNTLIAAGPDFRSGYASETASGNVDIAPTVLSILGIAPAQRLDGRILREAMTVDQPAPEETHATIEFSRDIDGRPWKQYLKISIVDGTEYIDEGGHGAAR